MGRHILVDACQNYPVIFDNRKLNLLPIIYLPVYYSYKQKLYQDIASSVCIRKALSPEPEKRFKILSQEAERS